MTSFLTSKFAILISVLLSCILLSACSQEPTPSSSKHTSTQTNVPISTSTKKENFFTYLLPMIRQVNTDVRKQRAQLLSLEDDINDLTRSQKKILEAFSKTYRIDQSLSDSIKLQQLSIKINTIPASLILAQAANESAWGTSRFAKEGNNFFGQWCFTKGCGLVPNKRLSGALHEVARFDSPLDSIRSYVLNLNRHPSYELLRTLRTQAIQNGKPITGELLAGGLIEYSARKEEYVTEIQNMIRFNQLERFNLQQ